MEPTPAQSRPCPPILAVGLLVASAAAAVAGTWAGTTDVGAVVAQRVTGARGVMSAESIAALQAIDFRAWLWGTAAAFAVAALLAWRLRPRWHAWLATETPAPTPLSLVALSIAVVLLRWPQTLTQGFFRYDDFDLLSVAQEHPWWRAIWLPHGDHVFPLTRVPAAIGLALFGTTAWPYNLGVLACMAAMIAMGCLLLDAWRVSRGSQLLFVALTVWWSPWGELMAGYYILSSYTLIAACGLAVAWAWLRWRETRRARFAWIAALALLTATLVDISGWYVPGVFGVFLAADFLNRESPRSLRTWLSAHRAMIGGVAFATAVSLACMVYAYAVVNRGLFLSMGGGQGRSVLRLAADFVYLIDVGLLVSFIAPFVYARLPLMVLGGLAVAAGAGAIWFLGRALKNATRPQRLALAAIAAVVAGIALMVALGRPSEGTLAVRWAAKHVGPAYVWLCLLVAFAWHVLWTRADPRRRALMAEITVTGLVVFGSAQFVFGRLGLAVAFPPFGYAAELRDATVRRAALDELRTQLLPAIQRSAGGQPIMVPTLDGPYLAARWPSLFDYNLATYAPFLRDGLRGLTLVRTAAMHPWPAPGAATVPSLRDAVSPAFIDLLRQNSAVRDYYVGHPLLRTRAVAKLNARSTTNADGTITLHVAGAIWTPMSIAGNSLRIETNPFDPDTTPVLQFKIETPEKLPLRLEVSFESDLAGKQGGGVIELPRTDGTPIEVDLRQIYAFALSRNVSNLRLVLLEPTRGITSVSAGMNAALSAP